MSVKDPANQIERLLGMQRATNIGEVLEQASEVLDHYLASSHDATDLELVAAGIYNDLILAISWLKKESPEVLAKPLIR